MSRKKWRAGIVLVGSEMDGPAFTKLLEDCGAMVVATAIASARCQGVSR